MDEILAYTKLPFLQGGGEMGAVIRSYDWEKNILGPPYNWPQSLKTTISIILNSKFPMFLFWGPQLICFYNDAYRPSLGKDGRHPGMLGMPAADAWQEIWDTIKPLIDDVLGNGEASWNEDQFLPIYRNGKLEDVYWTFSYSPVADESGKPTGVFVTCMETTGKVIALQSMAYSAAADQAMNEELAAANEELAVTQADLNKMLNALRESEANFRSMILQSPVAMGLFLGREMELEVINDKFLELWGRNRTVLGKTLLVALPELEHQPYLQIMQGVYKSGETYYGAEAKVILHREGKPDEGYYDFINHPFKDNTGKITGIMVVAIEVTEQVNARKGMERAFEQARLSKEAAQLGTFDMDLEKGTLDWDERCRTLFGISHRDRVTYEKDFVTGLHPDDRERIVKIIDDLFIKEKSNGDYDVEYRTVGVEDKVERWVRAKGKVYFDTQAKPVRFIGSVLDITGQIITRQQLKESEQNLALLADNISQLTWMANAEGYIFWYNKRWYDYTGTTFEDMQGWGWKKVHHPDYLADVTEKWNSHIASGEIFEYTFPLRGIDGHYLWFLTRAIPFKDEDGKVLRWFGTNTDITEQRDLAQQKDDFISIASHELKTPVTSLKASIQLLDRMKDNPVSPMLPKLVTQSARSVERITDLIEDLLDASKLNESQLHIDKQSFNISAMLQECCAHIRAGGKHHLIFEGESELIVIADEHRIDQVLVNFVNNAVKYAPDSSDIYLLAEKQKGFVKISVRDSGPGITADKLPHLFGKYYRAEYAGNQYSGLGLGLYISAEIIKRHGGQIGVESELGKGATFWFTLPV